MADEKEQKLGPNATYVPEDDRDKTPVTTFGVQFTPGKAVNLVDRLGEGPAAEALKKLSGNRFFKVDGGPDWDAIAEKKAQAEQQEQKDAEAAREEMFKTEQAKTGAPPPPDDWKGPDEAKLEKDSAAARPSMKRDK